MSKTIQIKGASEALKARLQASAERNFRSLNQEALARLKFSFDIEDSLMSSADQKWIKEAMAGDFKRGSLQRLKRIAVEVLRR